MSNCCSGDHSNAKDPVPKYPLKVGEHEHALDGHPRSSEEAGKKSVQNVDKGVEGPRIQSARSLGVSQQSKKGFKVKTSSAAEKGTAGDLENNQYAVEYSQPSASQLRECKLERWTQQLRKCKLKRRSPPPDLKKGKFKGKSFDKEQPTGGGGSSGKGSNDGEAKKN